MLLISGLQFSSTNTADLTTDDVRRPWIDLSSLNNQNCGRSALLSGGVYQQRSDPPSADPPLTPGSIAAQTMAGVCRTGPHTSPLFRRHRSWSWVGTGAAVAGVEGRRQCDDQGIQVAHSELPRSLPAPAVLLPGTTLPEASELLRRHCWASLARRMSGAHAETPRGLCVHEAQPARRS